MQKAKTLFLVALLMSISVFTGGTKAFAQVLVPLNAALDAMNSDSQVTVSTISVPAWTSTAFTYNPNFYYEFKPASGTPTEALIFYPGGNVDERAYSKIAHAIAAAGYLVALVPMPDYLAIYGKKRADVVITNHPEITKWSIGGHSFGAVTACWYITSNSTLKGNIKNVILLAGYPNASDADSLAAKSVKVLSIWGTNDGFTTSAKIDASKPYLPADTVYTALTGANHTQFGYYANTSDNTSFVQGPVNGEGPPDNPATITRQAQLDLIVSNTIKFMSNVPPALETITATDTSTWERVSTPGFGDTNNISVVAMQGYKGSLYALTRNQVQGCEVWRTTGTGWEQVLFPSSVTNGIYGNNWINNLWARMIVFNDKLYFGFSSGQQGGVLDSTGCEIWTFDGTTWTPVISDLKDLDASGTITAIYGCDGGLADPTATFTDSSKSWTTNQWAGGYVRITSGTGILRKFRIVSNTANVLTIQQNERAGYLNATTGVDTEPSNCGEKTFSNPFPVFSYTLHTVSANDSYEICMGTDENGFGEPWNKTITAMRVFNNKLYVSTGLNYDYGGQIWYTEDGVTWYPTYSKNVLPETRLMTHSFGNYHTDATYLGGYKPVSSSITDLVVSSVSGTPTLYAGGTGTSGNTGGCSRMAKLTVDTSCPDGCWELIVDDDVDANDNGSNENGFGSPTKNADTCGTNQFNFMPWSLVDFNSLLLVGVNTGMGARVLYSSTGSSEDGSWHYSVGTANVAPEDDPTYVDTLGTSSYPNGFDGYQYSDGNYQNLAPNFVPIGSKLWAGTVTQYVPDLVPTIPPSMSELKGSQIWTTTDGLTWHQVTANGFGDTNTVQFEAFTEYGSQVYVSGSRASSASQNGLGGAQIYRMATTTTTVPDDTDSDGVSDDIDNCPAIANPQQLDADGDKIGDVCDTTPGCGGGCGQPACEYIDRDTDGIQDYVDNCPAIANPQQLDADSDGIGDLCDATPGCGGGCGQPACESQVDTDGDLFRDSIDNCQTVFNPNQLDADTDGTGDCCDPTPGCGGEGQPACDTFCTL